MHVLENARQQHPEGTCACPSLCHTRKQRSTHNEWLINDQPHKVNLGLTLTDVY